MKLVKELDGERGNDIYAIEGDNGRVEAREYLNTLKTELPHVYKKLLAEISNHARNGPSTNPQKSRPLKGKKYHGLFEFKAQDTTGTARLIYCYHGHRRTVLLRGCHKVKGAEFRQQVDAALADKAWLDKNRGDQKDDATGPKPTRTAGRTALGPGVRAPRARR